METKAININLKGRNPRGIVDITDYDQIREKIIEDISDLKDEENGKKVVKKAWKREEIYSGPFLEKAPDIILELNEGYNVNNSFTAKKYITKREKIRGCHHREGILIACGDDFKAGRRYNKSDFYLWDIAPTVLHFFNIPIPELIDGCVLKEIFRKSSELLKRKVIRKKIKVYKKERNYKKDIYDQEEIEKRLKNLGYI